jgi:mRNA interferase RelE/StbE
MPYEIKFSNSALRDLKSLEKEAKESIKKAILVLAENPFIGDTKKLRLPLEGYRMRKGDYRILFEMEKSIIIISTIKHRKDVYK